MAKNNKTLIFHFNIIGHGESNPMLLRIQLFPEYTKIDFGYTTTSKYVKGGWIKIANGTFIEDIATNKKFYMTNAVGITIAPQQKEFESTRDWQYFSLYFPSLPQKDATINIIEKIKANKNDFNYYNIPLKMQDGIELL